MKLKDAVWHRLLSQGFYKNKKLPMGQMSFVRDFIHDTRSDLYPILEKSEDAVESVNSNAYHLQSGCVCRLMGQYFPYATYEVTFESRDGACGLSFHLPDTAVSIICEKDAVRFCSAAGCERVPLSHPAGAYTLIVTCRREFFDVYFLRDGLADFFHTFRAVTFAHGTTETVFRRGFVGVYAEGCVDIHAAEFYIDCGVGQADLKPVCYENGEVLHENGLIYLTFSIRTQENGFQGIFSWVPGTSQFNLTGALFFNCGDGILRNYLAASLMYNRKAGQWYIWVSAFEHQLRLAYGAFEGNPLYGVNTIDVTVMDAAREGDRYEDFVGFKADEDPDFFLNEKDGLWYLAVCRLDPKTSSYRYAFFRSDQPFTGYQYLGCGRDGAETGGRFVCIDGRRVFACGNDFNKRANYRIYDGNDTYDAKFDFDDGGFRGWGSIIPVKMGSRTRYFWVTFDRQKGSDYNWSYGNIYVFEAYL